MGPLVFSCTFSLGGTYMGKGSCPTKRQGKGLPGDLFQEMCLLLKRGARDGVALKRQSGLHQNTPRDELEWRLVMSPWGGSWIQAQLLRP